MSLRNAILVVLAAGLQRIALGDTSDFQGAARANTNLIHQWTFDGADDAERLEDKKGTAHLDVLTRGSGTPEDIGYGAAGFDPSSDAVSTFRAIPGGDHDGTAAFHNNEITLGYSVSYELVVQPTEAKIEGGAWNLGYMLATRVDSNRGYFALQGSAENDGLDPPTWGLDGNDISSIIGTSFDVANQQTMIETLQAGHWYYLAGAYTAAADNSTTTFTNYIADLTAGQRVLTKKGPMTVAGTYPTGPTPLGIGNRWDAGEAFPGLFDEVNFYDASLPENVFQEHLELLATPELLTWGGGAGNWTAANWDAGDPILIGPSAGMTMVIAAADDSVVTVTADFITGGTGPAGSVAVGETHTALLVVDRAKTLEVTGEVAIGSSGVVQIDGTLTAGSGLVAGALTGGGTINADPIEVTGTVAPGGHGIGTLKLGVGEMGLKAAATFDAQVNLDANEADRIEVSNNGALQLGGTLAVAGIGRTDADSWAVTSRRIVDNPEGTVGDIPSGTGFEFDDVSPLPATTEAAHVGQGAFLRAVNYNAPFPNVTEGVDVNLFIAWGGDADGDGKVFLSDWGKLRQNFSNTGSGFGWTDGNFDPWVDDKVFLSDWGLLRARFANADYTVAEGAVAAVPEPGTLVMLLVGLAGLLAYARRKR